VNKEVIDEILNSIGLEHIEPYRPSIEEMVPQDEDDKATSSEPGSTQ